MSEVSERLKAQDYPEQIKLAVRAARELGFTELEQASLLGYKIDDPKDFITVRIKAATPRNIDTERRAESLIEAATLLDSVFGDKQQQVEWLNDEQIPLAAGATVRQLLLSDKPEERATALRVLRRMAG